jgi:hypothetical protein
MITFGRAQLVRRGKIGALHCLRCWARNVERVTVASDRSLVVTFQRTAQIEMGLIALS